MKFLFFPTILALAFGLMLSCAKKDDSSSSETDTSSSSTVTVSGKVQKGPYVQGTEITVRELDSSMTPTGNTFTGSIDDNTGSFSIKGTLANKIAELAADGYYFNEVSGSLSTAKLALQAFSDLTDSSSVNVNLMTHLEKKRVEYLMDNSKMTFAAAKTQAQTEIMKIFNIDNVTLGNSETLDISKSGDGNAVLLAISAILQSDKTEAELTELLSTINTDIRTDGTLDSTNTKATLVTSMEYLKSRRSTIRTNIESRYSNLGISATIPAFESYAFKLDRTVPTVSSTYPSGGVGSSVTMSISASFSDTMDNTSITASTFTLKDNSSNAVSGTVSLSDNGTSTFTPSNSLNRSELYTALISKEVKDIGGNKLSSDKSWSFYIPTLKWADGYKSSDYLASEQEACVPSQSWCLGQNTQYVAQAFRLSQQTTIRFIGFGVCLDGGGTDSKPASLSIFSDNSLKPGSVEVESSNVVHPGDYINNSAGASSYYTGLFGNTFYSDNGTGYITNNVCWVDLDVNKKSLSSNTLYWVVASYTSTPGAFHLTLGDNLPSVGNNILVSTDGSNWTVDDNITADNGFNGRSLRLFLSD